jgi:hypothetical protein
VSAYIRNHEFAFQTELGANFTGHSGGHQKLRVNSIRNDGDFPAAIPLSSRYCRVESATATISAARPIQKQLNCSQRANDERVAERSQLNG